MILDRLDGWRCKLQHVRHSLMLRLLATVLVFSCVITVILTALQLYRDYERGLAQIENRLVDIDRSYGDSVGEALWRLDQSQLKLQLEGILRLPDIRAAEVQELRASPSSMMVSVGERMPQMTVVREFPIMYRIPGKVKRIGTLYVEATLVDLYDELERTAFVILVSQAANTFLAALFTFYVLSRLVTRHLTAIARRVSDYDFHEPPRAFVLQRKPPRESDELDRVVSAINAMGMRLHKAFLDEREATAEREARRLAEAANRAKGEFLANLSHELRTPLNGILGYAQILARDSSLNVRQQDGVSVIKESGEHLLTLIDDTLDFAKVEAGRLRMQIRDVFLVGTLETIRKIIGVKAEEHGLAFNCVVSIVEPSGVRADERRLRQVILNLLSNAVKFTDEGSVTLAITQGGGGTVRFEVSDTGIGIDEQYHEKIFLPFEQASGAERRGGGTGLGLAITRQFVRAMGGEIHVESEVGRGSRFWFELPSAHVQPSSGPVTLPASIVRGYDGPSRTALIIDDVAFNRAVIADLLVDVGFMVVEADNGLDGIALAQFRHPDVILTDIFMPGIDGLEVVRRLRAIPKFMDVPIIALSATSLGPDGTKYTDAGVSAFISKPVDSSVLLERIGESLGLSWICDTAVVGEKSIPIDAVSTISITISKAEMDELHRLARDGDMSAISRWAERIAADDPRNAAFADSLRRLARAYQSKAILQLVEQHLEGKIES
jgi:signal transduction histidine kinase/ActR/RegA family two-component response regulator